MNAKPIREFKKLLRRRQLKRHKTIGYTVERTTTATATATKTSPENITLFHLCYFAIISTRSTFPKMANYPGTKLLGVAYKLKKKMKNSPLCVHVLHKTLNVVISRCCFAEDGKEMYLNVNARAEQLFLLIKPIVLRRCRFRRCRRCLSSLIEKNKGPARAL